MKAIMEKAGLDITYQVDFCITGLEAFDLVKETYKSGMSYKLILTDFNMPVMDGIIATQKIRELLTNVHKIERKDQPLIVGITGHVHHIFIEEGKNAGMDQVVEKPFYVDNVKEILK
jgi:CheY-like chemotaxis protein